VHASKEEIRVIEVWQVRPGEPHGLGEILFALWPSILPEGGDDVQVVRFSPDRDRAEAENVRTLDPTDAGNARSSMSPQLIQFCRSKVGEAALVVATTLCDAAPNHGCWAVGAVLGTRASLTTAEAATPGNGRAS
jgi:hypothetical protein